MANKHRGEIEIKLLDRTFKLRPTFEALVEFEDKSGTTAYEALKSCMENQKVPAKSLAAAFWSGIRAAWDPGNGHPPTFSEVGALVQKVGIKNLLEKYLLYLTYAITGDEELKEMEEQGLGKGESSG